MKIEVIANDDNVLLRIKEESGKFLDLIMPPSDVHGLVERLMGAVAHVIEGGE